MKLKLSNLQTSNLKTTQQLLQSTTSSTCSQLTGTSAEVQRTALP